MDDFLNWASEKVAAWRRSYPAAEIEIFAVGTQSRTAEWSQGRPEGQFASVSEGMSMRWIEGGRLGFGFANKVDPEQADVLARHIQQAARLVSPDTLRQLPEASPAITQDLDLWDRSLDSSGWEKRSAFLPGIEEELRKQDSRIRSIYRASYKEQESETAVASSRGIACHGRGTHVSFGLTCVAVEDGETQTGHSFSTARHVRDVRVTEVVRKAGDYAVGLLGGRAIPSGRYTLVFDPLVAAEILELLESAVRADQVQKKRSFLAGRVGEKIGATSITLVDDGLLSRGVASFPFDAEGVPSRRTVLIGKGILQSYLYDTYTAARENRASGGNATRPSFKGVPEPGASNFFLEPGATDPRRLVEEVSNGIYVLELMGLHTADPVTGEFSLGLAGQRIEKGKRTHAVRGVTMAGSLLELLQKVDGVGSDVTFYGSVGAPTLRVGGLSIGGT